MHYSIIKYLLQATLRNFVWNSSSNICIIDSNTFLFFLKTEYDKNILLKIKHME